MEMIDIFRQQCYPRIEIIDRYRKISGCKTNGYSCLTDEKGVSCIPDEKIQVNLIFWSGSEILF